MLEVGAVLVGIYVAWVYHGQLNEMIHSNTISLESLVSVQRAFVTLSAIENERLVRPPGIHYYRFAPWWTNGGATVARSTITYFDMKRLENEPTNDQFKGKPGPFSPADIGPKAQDMGSYQVVDETELFGIDLGNIPLRQLPKAQFDQHWYLWGWVVYRDVFPDTKPHVTEICQHTSNYQLIAPRSPWDHPDFKFTNTYCGHHNCTDEDCEDYADMAALLPKR